MFSTSYACRLAVNGARARRDSARVPDPALHELRHRLILVTVGITGSRAVAERHPGLTRDAILASRSYGSDWAHEFKAYPIRG